MAEVINLEKLYAAYLSCRKRKRNTINALKFEWDLERNLYKLYKELKTRKYKPGRSICFVVAKPVLREIFAANFRDRVVQHILVNEVRALSERAFIFDSHACREGKGTHLAVRRLRCATRAMPLGAYYLQLDISGFFMSMDHRILFNLFTRLVKQHKKSWLWEQEVLWLAQQIIFHKPTANYLLKGKREELKTIPKRKSLFHSGEGKGLPIGNYSSQFFANLYLNELDQYAKRCLRCKHYFRYADDIVILGKNKKELTIIKSQIDQFLINSLRLKLNHSKTKIKKISQGIDFLGYLTRPDYVLVRKRVVDSLKEKIIYLPDCNYTTVSSYLAHFKHANAFNLTERCLRLWYNGNQNYEKAT